ncbi:MAG: response regulator transcription factor [Myxococcaceae bacterium]|jgi:two-component system LytT family response regulator|nr:response regulator transcription factor [Myxococcaceae bacterium]MCA3013967.1 response regulator transcription factor [Myxococcaceae bacterium]
MSPLRVLIADDEQLARARLTRLLSAMDEVTLVGEARDGDEVLAKVRAGGVDVVLLDVQMPKLTGVEAMALWPASGPWVVFCTAHAEHAVKAFEADAVDYLLKPVEPDRLRRALDRARQRETRERFSEAVRRHQALGRLPVQTRQGLVLLDPASVTHAVLDGELVTVHTRDAAYLSDYSLNELEQRLSGGAFERVHRRALLNLEAVTRLEPLETGGYLARTVNGGSVEVSRQAARDLRKRLGLRKASEDEG